MEIAISSAGLASLVSFDQDVLIPSRFFVINGERMEDGGERTEEELPILESRS